MKLREGLSDGERNWININDPVWRGLVELWPDCCP